MYAWTCGAAGLGLLYYGANGRRWHVLNKKDIRKAVGGCVRFEALESPAGVLSGDGSPSRKKRCGGSASGSGSGSGASPAGSGSGSRPALFIQSAPGGCWSFVGRSKEKLEKSR